MLAGNGYLAQEYVSALTVAVIMLIPQILLLMPLYVALVGGDLVAKEVEDGTLRMILSRPDLAVPAVVGEVGGRGDLLGGAGAGAGRDGAWLCPDVVSVEGDVCLRAGAGVQRAEPGGGFRLYLWSHLFMTLNASVVLGIAFMFSCFNMKPAAATILALSLLFVNLVMEGIPFFERYHEYLLTYHFRSWHTSMPSRYRGRRWGNRCAFCWPLTSPPSSSARRHSRRGTSNLRLLLGA